MAELHQKITPIKRRNFLGAGLMAVTGTAMTGRLQAASDQVNPFAFDIGRLSKTDPKLIRYEELTRFACPAECRRLTVGPDGNLYVAAGTNVTVLSTEGRALREIPVGGVCGCASVDAGGRLYVALGDHVEVFGRDGTRLVVWEAAGPKAWCTAIALADGRVFVADSGSRAILRYDESGKLLGRIGQKNAEASIPGLVVPSPYLDVEVAADGLLRVTNPGRHRVEAYTPEGDLEFSWGRASAGIEGFCGCCNPVSISLLPGGGYVTCEKGVPRVKVYDREGKFECVVAGAESFPENLRAVAVRRSSDGMLGGLDAAVDSAGKIYILDLVATQIRVMKHIA